MDVLLKSPACVKKATMVLRFPKVEGLNVSPRLTALPVAADSTWDWR